MEQWIEKNLRYILLVPAVLTLLSLTAFPLVYSLIVSFQKFNVGNPAESVFIGLDNFARLLSDDKFHNALLNTLIFTFLAVSIEFGLGLAVALVLDKYVRGMGIVKTILLIPMMLPPIAVAITWKLIFQPNFGVLNDILVRIGLEPLLWYASFDMAMITIILVDVWEWTPFIFLMLLAGLSSLPAEPYEAADLDGASAWQKFRDLTWPFLRPVVVITVLLRMMDAFRLFDQVYILTRGGPAGATETLSYYLYKVAFRFFDIGYAAAISFFMLFLTVAFSTWFIKRMQVEEE